MSISKILNAELEESTVSSLATRPSSPSLYGGRTLSAKELRAAFDKLPLLLVERFNALIDALGLYTDEARSASLAALVATGIAKGHSLEELFADITSGRFSTYLSLDGDASLSEAFTACKAELTAFSKTLDALSEIPRQSNRPPNERTRSTMSMLSAAVTPLKSIPIKTAV